MTDARLAAMLRRARVILLDFDGPVCSLFAGYPAPQVAADLRAAVETRFSGVALGDPVDGPLHMLVRCAELCPPEVVRFAADELRDLEVTAAASAQLTPGVDRVLDAATASGRRVVIVSNNATAAVAAYLDRQALRGRVDRVVGRHDGMDPRLLKPDPYLARQALAGTDPSDAVLVGDSTSDIVAAHAAGAPAIGYANKRRKLDALDGAGADAIVSDLDDLASAMREAIADA